MGRSSRDDRAARFEAVYRSTAAGVYAYCLRRGAGDSADDVVDDVYLVAWRRLDELPPKPLPWLLGVARRTLANQRRSRRRYSALVGRLELDVGHEQSEVSEPTPVLEALQTLPEADRELLLLVAWDGLTTSEAAQVLGCTAVAARVRLHRARRRLAAALTAAADQEFSFTSLRRPLGVRPKEEIR